MSLKSYPLAFELVRLAPPGDWDVGAVGGAEGVRSLRARALLRGRGRRITGAREEPQRASSRSCSSMALESSS